MLSLISVIAISYFVGAIPSSLWTGKLFFKIDIREHGSGNAGATNTFRILGWKAGSAVLLFDFAKGLFCTTIVANLAWQIGSGPVVLYSGWEVESMLVILCGVFAVVGHMFPVYASFDGGKGAATACGMLYGIEPISISISLLIFLIVMVTTRYVSMGSIVGSASYPVTQFIMRYALGWDIDGSIILFSTILAAGIIIKHKGNIRRLINGTENKVRSFKPAKGWLNKEETAT